MVNAREIKTKVASVQSTRKITKAMEMVATSKVRKAKKKMEASRPYATIIRRVVGHVALVKPRLNHPYFNLREAKRVGYIIVTSDRGLCGGLNTNLFRVVLADIEKWKAQHVEVQLAIVGSRGASFFSHVGVDIVAQTTGLGDSPAVSDVIGAVKVMLDDFNDNKIDRLFIANNRFINTMSQQPQIEQLMPLLVSNDEPLKNRTWDYIYEPETQWLLEAVVQRYIESQVYQAIVENLASEQAARMVAMKAATDNATDLINTLKIAYNKARQSAITTELVDIVSGAAAVSD